MRVIDPARVQTIIDTAACMFAERRYDEVRMEDIADRAGVSKGMLYHHFKDKSDLYLALILQGIQRLFEQVRERIDPLPEPEEKLRGFVEEVVEFFTRYPWYLDLIQRAEQSRSEHAEAMKARRIQFVDLLSQIIQEMKSSGRWAVDNPQFAALGLIGMTREVLRWQTPPLVDLAARIVRLFLHGLEKT
jgi:AcrR family transcriptional regulator